MGRSGRTTTTCGAESTLATGAKSLMGSQPRLLETCGVMAWKPEYCSSRV
ncbi:Uncharacterised protein [Bordetella pertussis]|nr:Uncharacterised protein [Bordetella pertussis]